MKNNVIYIKIKIWYYKNMINEKFNRVSTEKAAGISLLVSVIVFLIVLFGAQLILPRYFYETSDYYVLAILLELIPLGTGAVLYLTLTKQHTSDIIVFSKPQAKLNKKVMPWLIVMGAAMAIFGKVFINSLQILWINFLEAVGYAVSAAEFPPIDSGPVFLAALAGIAITPAIFEEIIFRGILQKGLLRNTVPKTAIIVSSLMFMLMHVSVENLVFTFVCGLLLGFMAYKSGSIIPSMAFHFVNNAFAVFGLYYSKYIGDMNIDQVISSPSHTIILIFDGIISFVLLAVLVWGFNKLAKSPPKNPYLRAMSPVTIITIVLSGCALFFVMAILALIQNIAAA